MTIQAFYEQLADILEIEPSDVSEDLILRDHSWDSLAVVSTIAMIDECFGVMVSGQELTAAETVKDIEGLISKAKATS